MERLWCYFFMPMPSRTQIVERCLGVKLPNDYAQWLESFEDIGDYPCVIGATERYRDHPLLNNDDLMIHFDEYLNTLVVLSCRDGGVYNVDFSYRHKIAESFAEWFEKFKDFEKRVSEEDN